MGGIAQWIRLSLPSCRPGIESQANHQRFYQFIFELCHVEKTKDLSIFRLFVTSAPRTINIIGNNIQNNNNIKNNNNNIQNNNIQNNNNIKNNNSNNIQNNNNNIMSINRSLLKVLSLGLDVSDKSEEINDFSLTRLSLKIAKKWKERERESEVGWRIN